MIGRSAERGPVAFHGRQLLANLAAGARLAAFLPVRAHEFRVSPLQYALLAGFNILLWIAAAAARAGFEGELDPSVIPLYLATIPLVLATALLASMAYGAPERLLLFAIAFIAADPVFELALLILPGIAAAVGAAAAYFAFLAWSGLVSLRAVVVVGGWRRPQLYQAGLAVVLMMVIAFFALPHGEVWLEPVEEGAPVNSLTEERLFHRQGELIAGALAGIRPGQAGAAELYFVGFAPDASQDVFLREMRFVKALFDERFGTAGRSIALASSHTALAELPVGTTYNLGRALRRVGEVMQPAEDVLFLFLSAHGDPQHRLSAFQPPLDLASLTPTALSRLLEEARIKWRVIVVSACYAGGYIEPLRDANTVVITAAAPDRSSFGCEHGRDFTYFGEAYFKEALASTRSFTAAFALAKDAVSRKEASEKLEPSQPQMWVGEAIAGQLKKLSE
jgi:hypothetical protein